MKHLLAVLALVFLPAAFAVPGTVLAQSRAPSPYTDIVIYIADDLGFEARYATATPNIDAMAAEGSDFQNCVAEPVCSPTRLEILFGVYPRRSGSAATIDGIDPASGNALAPPRELLSLAEYAKACGYQTALIGKWHLGQAGLGEGPDMAPHIQGFDYWSAGLANTTGTFGDSNYDWRRTDNGVVTEHESQYTGDAQRNAFIDYWTTHAGKPRFVIVAFSPPHAPFEPPPGKHDLFFDRQNYLQAATYFDQLLGQCRAVVNPATTVELLVGDNGTPGPARPTSSPSGHWKGSTFQGGIRVPFIATGPMVPHSFPTALTSTRDIPRMLAGFMGWILPAGSFEDSLGFNQRTWTMVERYEDGLDDLSILEIGWKYRNYDPDGTGPLPAVVGFYDLVSDPNETSLIPPDDPGIADVAARFADYAAQLPARF